MTGAAVYDLAARRAREPGPQPSLIPPRPLPGVVSDIAVLGVGIEALAIAVRQLMLKLAEDWRPLVAVEGAAILASAEALSLADEMAAAEQHLAAVEAELRALLKGAGR